MLSNNKMISILVGAILVYIVGFGIDIMDIDASQYAEMSREMQATNKYLQVFELGKDYLDKPPFLFWVSAISIKLLGANNVAYRLPSCLFGLFTLWSIFKFALLFYKKEIAQLAVIVLATSQAFFLTMHDVRTDTILMSWVIFSCWQLAAWFTTKKVWQLILGCAGIGFGMLTKGPIALIVPILALGTHLILSRQIKLVFQWQHIIGLFIIALILLPMSIGLYQQFDMQPNKIVNGQMGVSGLRFFYWTQSFGRITGESVWNNQANIFFLLQNLLWAFLPWVLIFFTAFFLEVKKIVLNKGKLQIHEEAICVGGFLLSYLALGSSKYQLPHYIFVVLPFAAIITAKLLYNMLYLKQHPTLLKIFEKSHLIIFTILLLALGYLLLYSFNTSILIKILFVVSMFLYIYYFIIKNGSYNLLQLCIFTFIGVNFFLNSSLYPSLLTYQLGSNFGNYISSHNLPKANIYIYQNHIWHSLHFYTNIVIPHKDSLALYTKGDYAILPKEKIADFGIEGINYELIYTKETFAVTRLNIKFINPITRQSTTLPYCIIKII